MKVSSVQQHQATAQVDTQKAAAAQQVQKQAQEAPKAPPPAHLGKNVDTQA